jgi:flagellar protein FlgJ
MVMELHQASMQEERAMGPQNSSAPSRRLVSAAHEFEGQMLKELLKPMTESDGLGGSDSGAQVLGEFGSEALGKALSEQGGFGIAGQIIAQLSHSGNRLETESVTTPGYFNTEMRRLK